MVEHLDQVQCGNGTQVLVVEMKREQAHLFIFHPLFPPFILSGLKENVIPPLVIQYQLHVACQQQPQSYLITPLQQLFAKGLQRHLAKAAGYLE